jgi:glycosyltransferase involved in cell wall biosynthesis
MRCPSLSELPAPPVGKAGWPWTIESPRLMRTRPDGSPWPRISIVTPSYNHVNFVEETIRSILLQGYPDLQYIIMDGGSTDGTVDVIKKYEPWLASWVSGRDGGTVDAINTGFSSATGAIFNWISSDDSLRQGALNALATIHSKLPEADIISGGRTVRVAQTGVETLQIPWMSEWPMHSAGFPATFLQEASFFSSTLWAKCGPLDQRFKFMFDVAFFARAAGVARAICFTDLSVSVMTVHSKDQKTRSDDPAKDVEHEILGREYFPQGMNKALFRLSRTRLSFLAQHTIFRPLRQRTSHFIANYDFDALDWNVRPALWKSR